VVPFLVVRVRFLVSSLYRRLVELDDLVETKLLLLGPARLVVIHERTEKFGPPRPQAEQF